MTEDTSLLIVRDLKALDGASHGRAFGSLLVVKKLASKTASNGNTFFSLELGDRTGSFSCTVINDSPVFEALKNAGEGAVVRIEGKVDLSVLVDERGNVADAKVLSAAGGKAGLNEAAVDSVRRWRFRPASKEGVNVKTWVPVSVNFVLPR